MRVFVVGDGKRDALLVPALLTRFLWCRFGVRPARFERIACAWKELRVGSYQRKLAFAIRKAIDAECDAVVATVDTDPKGTRERGERLRELQEGRQKERARGHLLPVALGEATPHAEAWLLDDERAVREALGLSAASMVPNVRRVPNPKASLEALMEQSERPYAPKYVLARIAHHIDLTRCNHADETGLRDFHDEIARELVPLFL